MHLLLAGATGSLGRPLVQALADRGHAVRVLVRDPARLGALADRVTGVHVGDVTEPDTLRGACDGVDAVISTVGASVQPTWQCPESTFDAVDRAGNLSLLEEARRAGVRRFVYVSVHMPSGSPGLAYLNAHADVEEALASSGMQAVIIRPTGYFSSLRMILEVARWRLGVVVGDGRARSNPIDDADLAQVVADGLEGSPGVLTCGGPETLSRREIARLPFEVLGHRGILFPVPAFAMRWLATLLSPLNARLAGMLRFYAWVLTHDAVAPSHGQRTLRQAMERWAL